MTCLVHGKICPSSVPIEIKPVYLDPSVFGNFSRIADTTHDGSTYRTFLSKSWELIKFTNDL